MSWVPFSIGDGLDDDGMHGRVSFGGASITLEFDADTNNPVAASRKVVIGIEEFAGCDFQRGFLRDRLHLRMSSFAALGGVPGAFQDAMTLRVNRRDRVAAVALADRLSTMLGDGPCPSYA